MKKKFSRILGVGLTVALLASLVFSVAPVTATITQPTVTLAEFNTANPAGVISKKNIYTIMFLVNVEIPNTSAGEIVVEFPSETTMGPFTTFGDVEVQSTQGFGSANSSTQITATDVTVVNETVTIVIDVLGNPIAEAALVKVKFTDDVTNPAVPGDYTLDVSTSTETTAVTSGSYTIEAPDLGTLPGIVQVYNPSDIPMAQTTGSTAIAQAIAAAGDDYTIMIGPGKYTEATITTTNPGVTFVATGAVESTTIVGDWTINQIDITLDGLTIQGEMTIAAAGDNATIKNCVLEKSGTSTTTADEMLLTYSNTVTDGTGSITHSTIDTTLGTADDDIGIVALQDGLTISDCTFLVDEDDIAVGTDEDTTVENNTFTGSSGVGVGIGGGVVTVEGNTFDGLDSAIIIDDWSGNPDVHITGNTIMNSTGDAYTSTAYFTLPSTTGGAIHVEDVGTGMVLIYNNAISGTADDEYVLVVEDDADDVYLVFNNITGNAMNVDNNDTGVTLDATHNWWGDADGPASASISADVDDSAPLAASVTGAKIDVGVSLLDAKTAAGVKVDRTAGTGTAGVIGAASYSANPFTATPLDALDGTFVDVYVGTAASTITEITVKIYSGDITDDTVVAVWSDLQGAWVACSDQGASTFGGYAWAKVKTDTTPLIEDLDGIPFVLLDSPEDLVIWYIDLTAPSAGSTDVPITNTAFTWTSVAGADSYMVALSANYDLSSPIFREFPTGTAYTYAGTLHYDTPYYWQVLASGAGDPVGESDVGTFTTAVEPGVPPAPTYTCPEDGLVFTTQEALAAHWNEYHGPAAPTYTCPEDGLVFTTQEALAAHWNQYHAPAPPEATPAYIWVIIAVGAVLVIGVLVLIVRTRRVV